MKVLASEEGTYQLDPDFARVCENQRSWTFYHKEWLHGDGPSHARVGDVICILYGCSMPIILQKTDSQYTFIGESYTYGLMDGEAFGRNYLI